MNRPKQEHPGRIQPWIPAVFFFTVLLILSLTPARVSAGKEPLPNDSAVIAELFGETNLNLLPTLTPPPDWQNEMIRDFRVLNIPAGELQTCTARVFLVTANMVCWIDTRYPSAINPDVAERLQNFDSETLTMLRQTFGDENNPGIDNDPRFHVVFTDLIGESYNGYFSSSDSTDPRVRKNSNGKEILFLNTSLLSLGPAAVIDTLVHESQHMIHFNHDRNEMSFIDEGLSGLAEYLAMGKIQDTFIRNYLYDTGRSLIWWPESSNSAPYYGSSFLFCVYLYDRFGADFIRDLVSRDENGLDGIDKALENIRFSGNADDVFLQWSAALLGQLIRRPVRDGDFQGYAFPQTEIFRDVHTLACGVPETHEIPQYGLRFYNSSCPGSFTIFVSGREESPVTSLPIPSGKTAWWSGAVSNSAALLSHTFDLREAGNEIFFEYDTVFDIENGYDYYYLLLTDPQGKVTRLEPSTVTADDPAGQNLGKGSTGRSGGILHEAIDLSPWQGQVVRLSFVYLTDTAGLSDGLIIDNIRIDAIGYQDADMDTDWQAEGFSRITASVPQRYAVVVLRPQPDGSSLADPYFFSGGETLTLICPGGNCAFAVSAVDRDVRARTAFTVSTGY